MVGAGNLATHMARALVYAGNELVQVYSRTADSAVVLSRLLGCEAVTDVGDIVDDAELYVLAVKDSALESVAAEVCRGRERAVFVHTAGSMPISLFAPYARRYGTIYPMQTFSKTKQVDFSEIPCFIEASDDATLMLLHDVCSQISSKVFRLTGDDRAFLHLAAVFACNFANHCYDVASRILSERGIGFDVMLPLIEETAEKVRRMTPSEAQTGPAVRFDRNVMDKHLALLADKPEWRRMYEMMSCGIHDLKKQI